MTSISTIDSLFAGGAGYLPEGQRSGIFKQRITDSVRVEATGILGDEQANLTVHGGPEKAVHHYPAENYARIAQAFPDRAPQLVPGSLGENISTRFLCETNVHIGDIFQVGNEDQFWQVQLAHRPCVDDLDALSAVPGLAPDWKRRLIERVKWSQARSGQST
ncbi:MOSC domain-containing protein [Burkholderia sp. Bp8963]|uniref:MOSC domain-containing protein n=1 Tax=Burkholderia sp. Bp8963 TaxID=2184547 RepID=UPI000F59E1F8|nr:MOSC domain-containing protein [Burkholderia sp. Bp8963]RQS58404.1 MOSC domain-containing protein [Burkholderia sp. Bp8963]